MSQVSSAEKTELISKFKKHYYEKYGRTYIPTGKDQGQAKFLLNHYGLAFCISLIDKFFSVVGSGKFVKAPPTISCMSYNRNELIAEIVKVETPVLEEDKFF